MWFLGHSSQPPPSFCVHGLLASASRMVHPDAYRMCFPLKIWIWWSLGAYRATSGVGHVDRVIGGSLQDGWAKVPFIHEGERCELVKAEHHKTLYS